MVRSRPVLSNTPGHVDDAPGVDPGAQRAAEERLPYVGRIAGLQARGERDLDVAAAAAGDGAIDDLHVRVSVPERVEQYLEGRMLGGRHPP